MVVRRAGRTGTRTGTGRAGTPVTPHVLDGDEREQAWRRIATAQPCYEKYQRETDREYPVLRLTPRRRRRLLGARAPVVGERDNGPSQSPTHQDRQGGDLSRAAETARTRDSRPKSGSR
ncbi:nitroreductase/quinone reductase family protein [Streptomyces sp. H10-C2]|nr:MULTISPECIES: nitroreductase/quinone reductase family protein [unclassified Streptomyces]MDJ0346648.1 nitroreductase/quinone reductase family protein [Streptomyces sp. PH10-H1]MDJ0375087.1 nitroreductase/quinone reductase family protein [Streptomyces sp. H10-C2]